MDGSSLCNERLFRPLDTSLLRKTVHFNAFIDIVLDKLLRVAKLKLYRTFWEHYLLNLL